MLTGTDPADSSVKTATVTRTGAGTDDADGTASGHTLNFRYTAAAFKLPTDASRGVVVRCAEGRRGDYVAFSATNTLRITDVKNPGGTIYVLDFAETANISASTNPDTGRFPLMTHGVHAVHPAAVHPDGA